MEKAHSKQAHKYIFICIKIEREMSMLPVFNL